MGVKVLEGGTVAPGATFDWENHSESECEVSDTGSFLTADSYTVPAKNGDTPGTTPATVQTGIANGDYNYSASNSRKRSNPKITVQSGPMP